MDSWPQSIYRAESGHRPDEWQMQLHFPSTSCELPRGVPCRCIDWDSMVQTLLLTNKPGSKPSALRSRVENAGFKPLLLLRHVNSAVLPSCSALRLISLPRPTGMRANENFRSPPVRPDLRVELDPPSTQSSS